MFQKISKNFLDFIYSGEIPTQIDIRELLEAARFLQMKDLINRLEKFEAEVQSQLRNLQPDVLLSIFTNQRKRNRKSQASTPKPAKNGGTPNFSGTKIHASFMEPFQEFSTSPAPSSEEIQIEEIGCDSESPPPPKMQKKENPTEIEVKVSDPNQNGVKTSTPTLPATGSSRRKGASQVIQ